MTKKGYVFVNQDGEIRLFTVKLSPFIKPLQGERILSYVEPEYDKEKEEISVVTPIPSEAQELTFIIKPK